MSSVAEVHFTWNPYTGEQKFVEQVFMRKFHALSGCVRFIPRAGLPVDFDAMPSKTQLCRLFLGQIPYGTSDEQLCSAISYVTRRSIYHVERILKQGRPTGCVHAYCYLDDVDCILSAERSILFDENGFWYPSGEEQKGIMESYCQTVKDTPQLRTPGIPYQPISVELAKSTYVPRS